MNPVRIVLVGVGGYARVHLSSIDDAADRGLAELVGVVAREADAERFAAEEREIRERGVPVFRTLGAALQAPGILPDLVSLPVAIAAHAPLSIQALEAGCHVYCEKPVAGTTHEALRMRAAAEIAGKHCVVGFQHIFSPSIQAIKRIAVDGRLGRLIEARTVGAWPRDRGYYRRNGWAGRIETGGVRIYDSPLQNAVSHYLQNMLYVAGRRAGESARPVEVYGENYRAEEIESADTQYIRIRVEDGGVLQFWMSHAVDQNSGPETEYIFEKGRITWAHPENIARVFPGEQADPAETFDNGELQVNHHAYASALESIRNGSVPLCTVGNSLQHTACIEASFASSGGVMPIDPEFREELPWGVDSSNTVVPGLPGLLLDLCARGVGFAEGGVPWARQGRPVPVNGLP